MQIITKILVLTALCLSVQFINAQDTIQNVNNKEKIELLLKEKEAIQSQERDLLKQEVEAINVRLEKGELTSLEADILKKEAAKKRALNIENRVAIVDNKIELLKRNEDDYIIDEENENVIIRIGTGDETSESFVFVGEKKDDKPRKYDKRTTSDFVLAFGFNNAIIEGEKLDDSPYKFGGSRFFEMGWAWKTRVFKESNFMRLKYGWSLQINGLKAADNQYFFQDGDQTFLEPFPYELKKAKLSVSNLVFPVHFEFGPSKKIERENYFRYSTKNQFKIGLGGYGGFNVGTRQKLKYTADGDRSKEKQKRSFNTSNLVYGLSGYLAINDVALYVKYDLSPLFKDQDVRQNNISLGLRFDVD
ncbi:hypothetical protein [Aestuariibaculum suncheonense]|uniref:Outer membrane protein beta-barrel domain-containing protein n=1 Tax=Aestuariibaculum suncheonense TaxID=1028745 RepID=A0A8J6UBA5_9FLAO|nr:hypothetical protein [Aestuariibaculum suncheonense]MBD0836143.1 hypothetical protein [Aestuariibaculum suncheonense]